MGISAKFLVWRATRVARRAAQANARCRRVRSRRRADWSTVDVNARIRHLADFSRLARRLANEG
jgi:hypothetical protein